MIVKLWVNILALELRLKWGQRYYKHFCAFDMNETVLRGCSILSGVFIAGKAMSGFQHSTVVAVSERKS